MVDLAERVLDLVNLVDIVFWPVAMDFKLSDVEAMPDKSITVSLINGGIRNSENKRVARMLREKSQFVVAYGACAAWGGIPGLANLSDREAIFTQVYSEAPTNENPAKTFPNNSTQVNGEQLELPSFLEHLTPLSGAIEVDYYVPGCPPTPDVTWKALETLLSGKLPPKGSVIGASDRSLCYECPLNETKPEKVLIKEFKRPVEVVADSDKCLLIQGLPCLGPVTRGGCQALCINGNMPCTGCFGRLDRVDDYGGKALSYLASILDLEDEKQLDQAFAKIPDVTGLVYKYSLPSSSLRGKLKSGGAQ